MGFLLLLWTFYFHCYFSGLLHFVSKMCKIKIKLDLNDICMIYMLKRQM